MDAPETILDVRNIKKYYPVKRGLLYRTAGWIKAVDDVSFSVARGTTLGLVGESGCGKTTIARVIAQLISPDAGSIDFCGRSLSNGAHLREVRKDLQIIFQDPFRSLDPRCTVAEIISEGLRAQSISRGGTIERMRAIVRDVGLDEETLERYPHEFSGGQRQRISIARSLVLNPKLLILDEPVSSLDVSIQAQIINLFLELQQKFSLTYLFIAHDLEVVRCMSDEICVMYQGVIVERASTLELFKDPLHPYTRLLLKASPTLTARGHRVRFKLDRQEHACAGTLKEVRAGHWVRG